MRLRRLLATFIRFVGGAVIRAIYQIHIIESQHVPTTGGALLLPNHVTFADAFLISAASQRPVRFVMDETFMASWLIRVFVSVFDTITIRREQPLEAIRRMVAALKKGELVCLFPEGQLSRTGTLCELQRGFELTARKADYPLIPMSCIGSWGSVFSAEKGKFLCKWPHRLPYGVTVAYGPAIHPKAATLEAVRSAMLEASAVAVSARFSAHGWREPSLKSNSQALAKFRQLDPEQRRKLWANGYQIGLVGGLKRRGTFHMLNADGCADEFLSLTIAFPKIFGAQLILQDQLTAGVWVGGGALRRMLETSNLAADVVFYDFSDSAEITMTGDCMLHLPCLALAGMVVSMSLPNPHDALNTNSLQIGQQSGSLGKLLPGWSVHGAEIHGAAASQAGFLLPLGMHFNAQGFIQVAER